MTLPSWLVIAPEDRIAPGASRTAGRARGRWAALASLLVHGTAVAAVLLAATGERSQLQPPAIEVSVVIADAPQRGAASATETERTEQVAHASEPVEKTSEPETLAEAPVEPVPAPLLEPTPPPVAEAAPVLAAVPPPPARKPDPPKPSDRPQAHTKPAEIAPAEPQPRQPESSATAAQLAALPDDGEGSDSAVAPGADTVVLPRYQAGGVVNPWPRYPPLARRRGIEGEVLLRVSVGLDGTAERVEVLRSSGHALLDRAAAEALARWHFEPARAAGQPVAGTVEIPVTFRLTDP